MIDKTLKRISSQLEAMIKNEVAVDRALDLLEASTSDLEEIIAINIMRESLQEMEEMKGLKSNAMPIEVLQNQLEFMYHNA
ncbi:MAG: hypothetical protein HOD92_24000 [Deltaproteobacteria bacterium]|jgi:hypothetical protein|nr:hypothetical protein [Deltaproteobacteria bacterium]MBT4527587.1 hypothetical protein [Deltaproteobacteria bacterium]